MRRFMRLLITLTSVGVICAVVSGNALAAPTAEPELRAEAWSYDEAEVADKKVAVSRGIQNGVRQLRNVMPQGMPKAKQKDCMNVVGGTNSYIDASGKLVKVPWAGKRARICRDASSPSGWRKVGPKNCGNPFWPKFVPQPNDIFRGRYKVVEHFTVTAKVTVKIKLGATVTAEAGCEANGAKAWAKASGSGVAFSVATASISAETRSKAIRLAESSARGTAMTEESIQRMRTDARNEAWLNLKASAQVLCEGPPPQPSPPPGPQPPGPTPPPTPKPNNPPSVVIEDKWEHIYVDRQGVFCAIVNDPDGDNVSVSFSASRGTTSSAENKGSGKWCVTYTAPETSGTDTIVVTVSDGRLSASASHTFQNPEDEF